MKTAYALGTAAGFWALLYMALVQQNQYAINGSLFLIWAAFALSLLVLFVPSKPEEDARPNWVRKLGAFNAAGLIFFMATFGWFFTAAAWLIATVIIAAHMSANHEKFLQAKKG